MLWKRIRVGDQERVLVARNGRFDRILPPGTYRVFSGLGSIAGRVSLEIEKHGVRDPVFRSKWANYLAQKRPDVAQQHFTRVETNELEVAMVYVDGKLHSILMPGKCVLFWRSEARVTAEIVEVIAEPELPPEILTAGRA